MIWTPPGSPPSTVGLFRHRDFALLFAGSTASRLGSAIAPIALAFGVLSFTHSAKALGIVVGLRTLANVALLLFGGALADRMSRSVLLVASSTLAGLAQVATAALLFTHCHYIALFAVTSVVNGAAAALALPASSAIVPQLVPTALLLRANAVSRLGSNLAAVAGASLAGLLAAFSPGAGVALDAVTFFVAALCFARLGRRAVAVRVAEKLFAALRSGWSEFVARTWLWVVVAAFALINAAGPGAINVLGPVWAKQGIGPSLWGLALACQMLGLVVGGLLSLRLTMPRLLVYGSAWVLPSCLPLWSMAASLPAWTLCGAFFVTGLGVEQFSVAWQTTLHQHVPDAVLARVTSYDMVGSLAAIPIGQFLAGPIAAALGLHTTLAVCGAAVLAAAVMPLGAPAVWRLRQPRPATAERTT